MSNEPTDNELMRARKLARSGADINEIHTSVWPLMAQESVYRRCKRYGISFRRQKDRRFAEVVTTYPREP